MTREIPWIRGGFRHVLAPPGMKAAHDRGASEQWYVNDHCIVTDDRDRLHWFGITNPYPADRQLYGPGSHRHIGHAVADHPFGPWTEREHALALPADTSDNIGACFVVRTARDYVMLYGYRSGFQTARSGDLEQWSVAGGLPVIDLGPGTRDPCVTQLEGGEYILYAAAGHQGFGSVASARSRDLINWTPGRHALRSDVPGAWGPLESPCVVRRGADYYLFVNHSHRQYEETLVFHSREPDSFDWKDPLCTLFGHAAEVLTWHGQSYITHCGIEDEHWRDTGAPYGLWMAELEWAQQA
jgi:hypothetical protein